MDRSRTARPINARTHAAILLLLLCCFPSIVWLIIAGTGLLHRSADDVSKFSDQRFAAVKSMLPSQGVIGYVGVAGQPGEGDYYLAQYAPAPLVIDRSPNHPLVIANFPASPPKIPDNKLSLVRDFGNGLALFANPAFLNQDAK